jgi:hypothetical protein
MKDFREHVDAGSLVVILITLVLFAVAIFVKGLGHDLLLESGVFLVSVKLIVMAYKSSVAAAEVTSRLDDLRAAVARLERLAEERTASDRRART